VGGYDRRLRVLALGAGGHYPPTETPARLSQVNGKGWERSAFSLKKCIGPQATRKGPVRGNQHAGIREGAAG